MHKKRVINKQEPKPLKLAQKENLLMNSFPTQGVVPRNGGFRMENSWVWCGSAVEEVDKGFHLYASRWRKDYPFFQGYLFFSEIVHAFSKNPEGPYTYVEKLLPCMPESNWDGKIAHNPTVVKWKDKYLLYYIGSTYTGEPTPADKCVEDEKMSYAIWKRLCIGLAIADSPGGPWSVLPHPVLEPRKDNWDHILVTNPAPCVLPDGTIYLYYRTNYPSQSGNSMQSVIGLAIADRPEGPYRRFDGPAWDHSNIEDPFVWHDGKEFNMIAKDKTAKLTGQLFSGAYLKSTDGRNWRCLGQAYSRNITYDDGEKVTLGALERPQLLFDRKGNPRMLFAAAGEGPEGCRNSINTWNCAIPLVQK